MTDDATGPHSTSDHAGSPSHSGHLPPSPDYPAIPGGYVEERLELGERKLRFFRPAEPDALLSVPDVVASFDREGDAPYWPLLWPPAVAMAKAVHAAAWPMEATVLEVGCGIGLSSLAAAARGCSVTASDNQVDAVRLAAANARLNGFDVEELVLDWRRPMDRKFDVILGCEVIYDAELHEPLLGLIAAMLADEGEAWLADHGRMHAPSFAERAATVGFVVELVDEHDQPLDDFRTASYQLLKLRRRAMCD